MASVCDDVLSCSDSKYILLQRNSGDICFSLIFHFLKKKLVYFIGFSQGVQTHTPVQKVAGMHTKSCLPTAIKQKEEEELKFTLGCETFILPAAPGQVTRGTN